MQIWQFLGTWTFSPLAAAGIAGAGAAYLWAAARVTRQWPGRPWPRSRTASFGAGLLVAVLVLLGPIGAYTDVFFWAQMAAHIALMMVIAPLLLLGSPVLLILRATPPHARRRRVVPVLRSRALRTALNPVLTWVLFAGVMLGTHFSPFYDVALRHPDLREFVEYPLYLAVSLLFYYPLIGADPCPRRVEPPMRMLSLFLMMLPSTMTGFFIYASNFDLYPYYAHVHRPFGLGTIASQQIGGALMWAGGMIIDAGWLVVAVAAWLRADQVRTRRVDAEIRRQLAARDGPRGPERAAAG